MKDDDQDSSRVLIETSDELLEFLWKEWLNIERLCPYDDCLEIYLLRGRDNGHGKRFVVRDPYLIALARSLDREKSRSGCIPRNRNFSGAIK
ncbi:MAG TPA: hypothetical protein VK255_03960 [Patescibacteria group bacterium]|nr:hypothetical protein [Patescibacteria group bacterium]